MNTRHFSDVEALRFGWNTTRAHPRAVLVPGVSGLLLALLSQALGRTGAGGALLGLGVQVLQIALALLLTRIALRLYDGEDVDLSQPAPLLEGFRPWLLTTFLYGLVVAVGLALLVVPGVIAALAFGFAPFFAAEGQRDPVESFRSSVRLVRGEKRRLLGLALLLLGVNLVGLLALGVGVAVTVPMTFLCLVFVFRRLQGRTEAVTPQTTSMTPRPV